jgi:hypothetical protein
MLKLFNTRFRKSRCELKGRKKEMSSTAMALQSDAMWLHAPNYDVAALNPKLTGRLPQLKRALQTGVAVSPDITRNSFYDVELADGWAYIHVRDDKRTVYLVAYSRL